jgi:hypothetical protein
MGLLINEVRDKIVLILISTGLQVLPRPGKYNDPEAIKEANELMEKYNAGKPILFNGEIKQKNIQDEKNHKNQKTSFWRKLFGH